MGLMQGIRDYDELCANKELYKCVCETDIYYSQNCDTFR